jgi:Diacylglycerol kinase catalytic domain
VNPNSGTGIANKIFDEQVAPLLVDAELPFDLQLTQGPNYARNYVRQRPDLAIVYSDIIIVSGDGLLFEVNLCTNWPHFQLRICTIIFYAIFIFFLIFFCYLN